MKENQEWKIVREKRNENMKELRENNILDSNYVCKKIICEPSSLLLKKMIEEEELNINYEIAHKIFVILLKESHKRNKTSKIKTILSATLFLAGNYPMNNFYGNTSIRYLLHDLFTKEFKEINKFTKRIPNNVSFIFRLIFQYNHLTNEEFLSINKNNDEIRPRLILIQNYMGSNPHIQDKIENIKNTIKKYHGK